MTSTQPRAALQRQIWQIANDVRGAVDGRDFKQYAPLETLAANDRNLSVSSYIQAKDNREVAGIAQINAELKTTHTKLDQLRGQIDAIVAEIEGPAPKGDIA